MLRNKFLSFIGFRKRETAVDKATAMYADTMRKAPQKFKATLRADIIFLSELLEADGIDSANESSGADAATGSVKTPTDSHETFFDFDVDETVVPDSQELAAQEQKVEELTRANYYNKARLAKLLTDTANYQSWLKADLRKHPDDHKLKMVEYMSSRNPKELKCFPEYAAELVNGIENSTDHKMAVLYHVLLLNSLMELKTELGGLLWGA